MEGLKSGWGVGPTPLVLKGLRTHYGQQMEVHLYLLLKMRISNNIYHPQMKFAKVMFLHLSLCLSVCLSVRPTPEGGGSRPRPNPNIWLLLWAVHILLDAFLLRFNYKYTLGEGAENNKQYLRFNYKCTFGGAENK